MIHSLNNLSIRHMGQSIQKWTKQNLWKTAFKKSEMLWPAEENHINSIFLKTAFPNFKFVHQLNNLSFKHMCQGNTYSN